MGLKNAMEKYKWVFGFLGFIGLLGNQGVKDMDWVQMLCFLYFIPNKPKK